MTPKEKAEFELLMASASKKYADHDDQGAIEDCDTAIGFNLKNEWVYYIRASAKADLGNFAGAIDDYTKTVETNPKDEQAYFKRGVAKADLGNFASAIEDYDMAIEINPNNDAAYLVRGVAKFRHGNFDGAIDDFSKAIEINPKNATAYYNRGNRKAEKGNFASAFDDFSKAIEINPKFAEAYVVRGAVKSKLGNFASAFDDFSKAIEINPKVEQAYSRRALAKFRLGNFAGVVEDCDIAIGINPKNELAYFYRGGAKFMLNDFASAVVDYTKAIEINPKDHQAFFARGSARSARGNFADAIDDFSKAIEINPKNDMAYDKRGKAKTQLGNFVGAVDDYSKAIGVNPKNSAAYMGRGIAKSKLGRIGNLLGAVDDFSKAIEIDLQDSDFAYYNRGKAKAELGNFAGAIDDFSKAIEINPKNDMAYYNRDRAKSRLGSASSWIDAKNHTPSSQSSGTTTPAAAPKADDRGLSEFNASIPSVSFSDVGGMEKLKEELRMTIIHPIKRPDLSKKYGVKSGGGVLLYGPPGCGKTFIAKAVAGEAKAKFVEAKVSEILDMWVGSSERNLHKVFEVARASAKEGPVVLFFDEVEALGTKRSGETHSATRKLVNAFLTEMDGSSANNKNVLVLGATNAPWLIDPALKRSGRFGKSILVREPDQAARTEIFKIHIKDRPIDESVDVTKLARLTEGFSSADLADICDEAAKIPFRESLTTGQDRWIKFDDFVKVIQQKKPTCEEWYQEAIQNGWKIEDVTEL